MALTTAARRSWTKSDSGYAVLSLFASVAPVVLMGIEWAVAWLCLGRRPVPSMDDPKSIEGLPSVLGWLTGASLVLSPVTLLVVPLAWAIHCGESRIGKILAGSTLFLGLSSIMILRSDPLGITSWWFD
jgi:hypothetical protein